MSLFVSSRICGYRWGIMALGVMRKVTAAGGNLRSPVADSSAGLWCQLSWLEWAVGVCGVTLTLQEQFCFCLIRLLASWPCRQWDCEDAQDQNSSFENFSSEPFLSKHLHLVIPGGQATCSFNSTLYQLERKCFERGSSLALRLEGMVLFTFQQEAIFFRFQKN